MYKYTKNYAKLYIYLYIIKYYAYKKYRNKVFLYKKMTDTPL